MDSSFLTSWLDERFAGACKGRIEKAFFGVINFVPNPANIETVVQDKTSAEFRMSLDWVDNKFVFTLRGSDDKRFSCSSNKLRDFLATKSEFHSLKFDESDSSLGKTFGVIHFLKVSEKTTLNIFDPAEFKRAFDLIEISGYQQSQVNYVHCSVAENESLSVKIEGEEVAFSLSHDTNFAKLRIDRCLNVLSSGEARTLATEIMSTDGAYVTIHKKPYKFPNNQVIAAILSSRTPKFPTVR